MSEIEIYTSKEYTITMHGETETCHNRVYKDGERFVVTQNGPDMGEVPCTFHSTFKEALEEADKTAVNYPMNEDEFFNHLENERTSDE